MKWMLVAMPLPILMIVMVFMNFFNWHNQSVYDYEQRQMDLQVNYSVSAATQEMLNATSSIVTDYVEWKDVTVDPEVAWNTYQACLVRNLGWADTEENRVALVDSCVPFFCVAGYDGYYMLLRQPFTEEYENVEGIISKQLTYPLIWSPKLPYSTNRGNDYYALNLGYKDYVKISGAKVTLHQQMATDPTPIPEWEQRDIISAKLSSACTAALVNGLATDIENQIYIPAEYSNMTSANAVEGPSVLTYLVTDNGWTKYGNASFGVGGAKIDKADFCICYEVDGVKKYTLAHNKSKLASVYGTAPTISRIYQSAKMAARNGYYFDTNFI